MTEFRMLADLFVLKWGYSLMRGKVILHRNKDAI
jgi:hypothetical protein